MVPWPNLITGAVGVAGIGGTILAAWMTGKRQTANLKLNIDAENNRHRLAEKRRIYAKYQASLDNLIILITRLQVLGHGQRFKDSLADLGTGLGDMHSALSELSLIAPPQLGKIAEEMASAMTDSAERPDDPNDLPKIRKRLHEAMRADLGEPGWPDELSGSRSSGRS